MSKVEIVEGTRVVLTPAWITGLENTLRRLGMEGDCSHLRGRVATVEKVGICQTQRGPGTRTSYWLAFDGLTGGCWYPKTSVRVHVEK